jgi:hypothetical protein
MDATTIDMVIIIISMAIMAMGILISIMSLVPVLDIIMKAPGTIEPIIQEYIIDPIVITMPIITMGVITTDIVVNTKKTAKGQVVTWPFLSNFLSLEQLHLYLLAGHFDYS